MNTNARDVTDVTLLHGSVHINDTIDMDSDLYSSHILFSRHAWDLALDLCLQQLTSQNSKENFSFTHSPFFAEQLTAFKVWLDFGDKGRRPPEQLPIVLQVRI